MNILGIADKITKFVASATEFEVGQVLVVDTTVDDGVKVVDDQAAGVLNEPKFIALNATADGDTDPVGVIPLKTSPEPFVLLASDVARGAELSANATGNNQGSGKTAASGEWVFGLATKAGKAGEYFGFDPVSAPYRKA